LVVDSRLELLFPVDCCLETFLLGRLLFFLPYLRSIKRKDVHIRS